MFDVKITTKEKIIFNGKAKYLVVPNSLGTFGIMKNHVPIISFLNKGEIKIETNSSQKKIKIEKGFLNFENNLALVSCEEK